MSHSIEIGDFVLISYKDAGQYFQIRQIDETGVTVDFNHPLAGQAITFDVEIIAVR